MIYELYSTKKVSCSPLAKSPPLRYNIDVKETESNTPYVPCSVLLTTTHLVSDHQVTLFRF
jgi:hypothetical protein